MIQNDVPESVKTLLKQNFGLLINGTISASASGETFQSFCPSDDSLLANVPAASSQDVDAAVASAQAAFKGWAETPLVERQKMLLEISRMMISASDDLGALDALDTGSLFSTMQYDAAWGGSVIEYMCGSANEVKGEVTQFDRNLHYTKRVPFGVAAKLLPFNRPIQSLVAGFAAPLLMGNCLILKASPYTPLSALAFGRMIKDILPPGVVSVLTGTNDQVSTPIITHPGITRLALTGSVAAGRAVSALAAQNLKSVSMELGGKNPLVIFPDADPELAADIAIAGMNFAAQSQSCSSTSRILVHKDLKAEFLDVLVKKVSKLKLGFAMDSSANVGAMTDTALLERVLGYIDAGQREGAQLLIGGTRPDDTDFARGNFVTPAVFCNVKPNMTIAREEIFGPVISVMDWDNYDDMIAVANDTKFGLTAVIVTNDLHLAHTAADDLQAGYVEVNSPVSYAHGSPYGGVKQSGNGRDGSIEELLSYTQIKSINVNFKRTVK